MPVTIRDVARACDVHVSTVSRTFSAPHLVNPVTRSRVLAAADALGYRPNRAARALVTGRTHNIGLIVADIANPFFPPLIKAAEGQARRRDHHVFVADTNEDPAVEQELVRALAKQVDGILLCSPRMSNANIERLRHEVPLAVVNRVIPDLPAVLMDVAHGARQALDHLSALGHHEIVYLSGPHGSWTSREIGTAVQAGAREHGLRLRVLGPHQPTETAGQGAAEQVLACGATAVLAYNDLMAVGLLEGLDALGVPVPEQVSVVGIDDIALSRFTRPRLTTVTMPAAAAGTAAVDLLLHGTSDGASAAAQVRLPTSLVVRQSSGPAAASRPGSPRTALGAPR